MNKEKNNIRFLREKHKLTQQAVADFLGVSLKAYRNYEKSPHTIPMKCAIQLSDKYNVSLDYLLNRYEYTTTGNEYIINALDLNQTSIDTLTGLKKQSDKEDYISLTLTDTINHLLANPLLCRDLLHNLRLFLVKNEYDTLCYLEGGSFQPLPYQTIAMGKEVLDNANNPGYAVIGLGKEDLLAKTTLENMHALLYKLQEFYSKEQANKKPSDDIPGQTHINDYLQEK